MHAGLRVRLGALAMVGSAAALVLAGGPALASTTRSVTGPEVISGALHGAAALSNNPVVPVTLRGLVTARGTVSLGSSSSKTHTVPSTAGNLVVLGTGYKHSTQTQNTRTCHFTFTQDITFSVLGGQSTGAFAGASGHGAAQVRFAAFEPRFTSGPHKGQCNGNAPPLAKGAVASFLASIVLTAKQ
jgi:hypothetical protein